MHLAIVGQVVGLVTALIGVAMLAPLGLAMALGERDVTALAISAGVAFVAGSAAALVLRRRGTDLGRREGLVAVFLSWVAAGLFGALPYWLYARLEGFPALDSVTACLFETMSGLTTTGATVIGDVESLPHGLLLWRSMTQWLGGMGIVVLFVAVLPMFGLAAQALFRAEVPGTTKDKITPHLRDTARLLWSVYVGITVLGILALALAGMGWFDAVCHGLATMATGGFSTRNTGIMAFDSPAIELVLVFFMAVAGINFALHVRLLNTRQPRVYWRDLETRLYLLILAGFSLAIALTTWIGGAVDGPLPALRHGVFQVVSLMTTTGFNSADFGGWLEAAPLAPVLLIVTMMIGGSSGSTAGSMKVSRLIVLIKHGWRELALAGHPRAVIPVRVGGQLIPEPIVSLTAAFFFLYMAHFVVGTALVALTGEDLVTSISAVAATLGNVGPGFGAVGPTCNYAGLSPFVLWVLTYLMLVGRLELITALVLLSKTFWRR
ncbi:MAG: TrkH family potassium uptake protein [Deltaproteobacteria bacterium]|nr:TrkH family potassium uptake protein [Deltaproteobacteria bacterium]